MKDRDDKSFLELLIELKAFTEEVVSVARTPESEIDIFNEFASILEKFPPVLDDIKVNYKVMDKPWIRKAVETLEMDFRRAKTLIKGYNSGSIVKQMEDLTQDIGRSTGLLLFASNDLKLDVKENIRALHKELMNARFSKSLRASPSQSRSPSHESVFVSDSESRKESETEEEMQEIVEERRISLGIDDVVLQLKYGDGDKLRFALFELNGLVCSKTVDTEWINEEGIISILVNRLGTSKPHNGLCIIQILRSLASDYADYKEKMADVDSLLALVKSLTRDVEERREALGLLLDLSDLPAVWRRLGRIQGCIVMLVAMLNGDDDPVSSNDAGKLLNALSSNTQNALHMAEAGYFKPLVHYLQEGSDMVKILMATTVSRMELTDQSRASLGEDGAIEPLVKMFRDGKLEAKLSALSALHNLSIWGENVQRLIGSGIVVTLLQLLFSVTSVLMTLREPASAILARIAKSESILVNQDVAQQMLSLLNLTSPMIQCHLLQALNSIAAHSSASNVRRKMKENSAIQLLLPFLTEANTKVRTGALNLICTLSKDLSQELAEQLGETHLRIMVDVILSASATENEKAATIGILSNLLISDKKATDLLKKMNLLPILISTMTSNNTTPTSDSLAESVAGVLIQFTVPSDKKLQLYSVEQGVIPLLVKLLSTGSVVAKSKAAASLAQLSQNSLKLSKGKRSRWSCVPPSAEAFCEVHDGYCFVKSNFCLVKAGALPPLIKILEGDKREADESVLSALATLLQDETWESGSNCLAKMSGIQAIIKVLESGNLKTQEKALWILERIFRIPEHRLKYGESAQVVLIDLAQNSE